MKCLFVTIIVSFVLLVIDTLSYGQNDRKYPVSVEFKADQPDSKGWQKVTVLLSIKEGWHVNANPAGVEIYVR